MNCSDIQNILIKVTGVACIGAFKLSQEFCFICILLNICHARFNFSGSGGLTNFSTGGRIGIAKYALSGFIALILSAS